MTAPIVFARIYGAVVEVGAVERRAARLAAVFTAALPHRAARVFARSRRTARRDARILRRALAGRRALHARLASLRGIARLIARAQARVRDVRAAGRGAKVHRARHVVVAVGGAAAGPARRRLTIRRRAARKLGSAKRARGALAGLAPIARTRVPVVALRVVAARRAASPRAAQLVFAATGSHALAVDARLGRARVRVVAVDVARAPHAGAAAIDGRTILQVAARPVVRRVHADRVLAAVLSARDAVIAVTRLATLAADSAATLLPADALGLALTGAVFRTSVYRARVGVVAIGVLGAATPCAPGALRASPADAATARAGATGRVGRAAASGAATTPYASLEFRPSTGPSEDQAESYAKRRAEKAQENAPQATEGASFQPIPRRDRCRVGRRAPLRGCSLRAQEVSEARTEAHTRGERHRFFRKGRPPLRRSQRSKVSA